MTLRQFLTLKRGPRLTLAEKTELWRRWRRGESLNGIGRALATGYARGAPGNWRFYRDE